MPVPINLALSAPARDGNSAWIYSVPIIAHMAITAVQATEYAQPRMVPTLVCRKREVKVKTPPAEGAWRVREIMQNAMTSMGKKYAINMASGAWWPDIE
ncbi:hypothetical protein PMHK_01180 [Pseudomonas sp. MHK4]